MSQSTPSEISAFEFADWEHFKTELFSRIPNSESDNRLAGRFLFRGQKDAHWPLVSSFDREFPGLTDPAGKFDQLINLFKEDILRYDDLTLNTDINCLIATAQHFGLPPRFLDWTRSPYTASFFAYSNADGDEDNEVAVWVLDQVLFESSIPSDQARIVRILDPRNVRLRNQEGLFTFNLAPNRRLEDIVGLHESECLTKFILPARERRKALEDLYLMGVSFRGLFPGVEGLAKDVRMKFDGLERSQTRS